MKNLFTKKEMSMVKRMVRSNVRGFVNHKFDRMYQYVGLAKEMVKYAMYNEYADVSIYSIWANGYKNNKDIYLYQFKDLNKQAIVANMYYQQAINAGYNIDVLLGIVKVVYDLGYINNDDYQGFFMPSTREVIEALK